MEVDRRRDQGTRKKGWGVLREEGTGHASAHDILHDFLVVALEFWKCEGINFFFSD